MPDESLSTDDFAAQLAGASATPEQPAQQDSGAEAAAAPGEAAGEADPSLPWAMAFPQSGSMIPRHPSPLYQFFLEGLLLFVILWLYARKPRGPGQVSGLFLIGYGLFRFIAEFFREPDAFLGLLALNMSMGQWLCVPMVVAGAFFWVRGARQGV